MNGIDEWIRGLLQTERVSAEEFEGTVCFPPEFPGFQGHFPGNPMLPGVCHIVLAQAAAERAAGRPLELVSLRRTKFVAPAVPGKTLKIHARFTRGDGGLTAVEAEVTGPEGERISKIGMTLKETES